MQLEGQLHTVVEENNRQILLTAEVRRGNEQPGAEIALLTQWVYALEQDSRLPEVNTVVT
jgi:hypothetical protein